MRARNDKAKGELGLMSSELVQAAERRYNDDDDDDDDDRRDLALDREMVGASLSLSLSLSLSSFAASIQDGEWEN